MIMTDIYFSMFDGLKIWIQRINLNRDEINILTLWRCKPKFLTGH